MKLKHKSLAVQSLIMKPFQFVVREWLKNAPLRKKQNKSTHEKFLLIFLQMTDMTSNNCWFAKVTEKTLIKLI